MPLIRAIHSRASNEVIGKLIEVTDIKTYDPLKWAIDLDCDPKVIEALVKKTPDIVNCKYKFGDTPLHQAVHLRHFPAVKLLLPKSNLDAQDRSGATPLHEAVLNLLEHNPAEEYMKFTLEMIRLVRSDKNIRLEMDDGKNKGTATAMIQKEIARIQKTDAGVPKELTAEETLRLDYLQKALKILEPNGPERAQAPAMPEHVLKGALGAVRGFLNAGQQLPADAPPVPPMPRGEGAVR